MKNFIKSIPLLMAMVGLLLFSGCAVSGHKNADPGKKVAVKSQVGDLSKDVRTDNGDYISWPTPAQIQKLGIKYQFVFKIIMPDDFILENPFGVHDLYCLKKDGRIYKAFVAPAYRDKHSGFVIGQVEGFFEIDKDDKFILLDRLHMIPYNLVGGQILKKGDKSISSPFDSGKFRDYDEYRQEYISNFGSTPSDAIAYIARTYGKFGSPANLRDFYPVSYRVGSQEWIAMANHVEKMIQKGEIFHIKDKGKEMLSKFNQAEYDKYASEMTDFTKLSRFFKDFSVPIISTALIVANPSAAIMAAGNVTSSAVTASIDDGIKADTLLGVAFRHQLVGYVRFVCEDFRALLREKNQRIFELEERLGVQRPIQSLSDPGSGGGQTEEMGYAYKSTHR